FSPPNRLNHEPGRGKPAPTVNGVVAVNFQRPLACPWHELEAGRLKSVPLQKSAQRASLLTFNNRKNYGKSASTSSNRIHRYPMAKKEAVSFHVAGDVARNINRHPPDTQYVRIQRAGLNQSAQ
ncbi:MAG: hypothetical protein ACREA2_06605, partial [Blastocatellia bacterium]